MKPVLMCGGVGTKMWPASRRAMPKHFLPLFNGKSLFEINYELLTKKYDFSDIYVSTTESQYEVIKKIAPKIPGENYFLEPELKHTGPAIGFVAAKLYEKFADEVFVIIQTDVIREPGEMFLDMLDKIEGVVKEEKKWVTGAIRPPFLMRGVDYMRSGENLGDGIWQLSDWLMREREDDIKNAIETKTAWLHANHYAWTPRLWLQSYIKYVPQWGKPLMEIANGGDEKRLFGQMPEGQTEEWTIKSVANNEGVMIELPFRWMDFGTWESLDVYLKNEGVASTEDVLEIDSNDNFIKVPKGKFVATIGVEDLIVVDTEDALLICKKNRSGRVGDVVEYLKAKNPDLL